MANYPMSKKVLELTQADKDQLEQVLTYHELPLSNRMRSAMMAAFKIGYEQRNAKGERK